jgi:PKD repeat protein
MFQKNHKFVEGGKTRQVVSHVYGMAGSYTVTVTATNGVSGMVVSAVVVVLEEPVIWTVYMPVAIKP